MTHRSLNIFWPRALVLTYRSLSCTSIGQGIRKEGGIFMNTWRSQACHERGTRGNTLDPPRLTVSANQKSMSGFATKIRTEVAGQCAYDQYMQLQKVCWPKRQLSLADLLRRNGSRFAATRRAGRTTQKNYLKKIATTFFLRWAEICVSAVL